MEGPLRGGGSLCWGDDREKSATPDILRRQKSAVLGDRDGEEDKRG